MNLPKDYLKHPTEIEPNQTLHPEFVEAVEQNYGLTIVTSSLNHGSYSGRAWNIATNKGVYLLKTHLDTDSSDLTHHEAEASFADTLNEKLVGVLQSVRFARGTNNTTIFNVREDDYVTLIHHEHIVSKSLLTTSEQFSLGQLMARMHQMMRDFNHAGLGSTDYMRTLDPQELSRLPLIFPDGGYEPYVNFFSPLNYSSLGLSAQVIHGDWHQGNMSFADPPLLFDLDTLALGTPAEEIARTITHWSMDPSHIKPFFDALTAGYATLSAHELSLIPRLAIAQLYRKYFEFLDYEDVENAQRIKHLIPYFKQAFDLN
jgi:Ser/Thr protein kinase RdoA (MazF antagonist)